MKTFCEAFHLEL